MQVPGVLGQGNVKVSVTLLNWIHNSRLSKNPPFPPFEKGGNRKSPFVKGDLEGFSSAQHDFDETLRSWREKRIVQPLPPVQTIRTT